MAVTDAYSAVTTDRPYRMALTSEEARSELIGASGTQFDPKVVAAFIAVLGEPSFPRASTRVSAAESAA